jgi:hypothetical protein
MEIMDEEKKKEREAFMKLRPLQRAEKMSELFNQMVKLRALKEGISELEAYNRYLQRDHRSPR